MLCADGSEVLLIGNDGRKRNMHPNHLARLIIETVVDEGMIDAVLDDG